MNTCSQQEYMSLALSLAQRGRFTVSPNPMVGCVIVNNNEIVGEGYHQRAGDAHAEIHALAAAGSKAMGGTAYVTLEPCCHFGRTPPCTDALIAAGIKKVVIACTDPNPLVAGAGVNALQAAGIEVEIGSCELEAKALNEIFFHYIKHRRPFVIAKWAMSLDGKTVTNRDDARDISSLEAQKLTHTLRQSVDAIIVGAKTATHDNPLLTARINAANETIAKQPIRIVLASKGKLPFDLNLFAESMPAKTMIAITEDADVEWLDAALAKQIHVITLPKNKFGKVDLNSLLDELGHQHITSVLVEGGMTVHEDFFRENLVNKIHIYLAPVIIGNASKKQMVSHIQLDKLACDFHITAALAGK